MGQVAPARAKRPGVTGAGILGLAVGLLALAAAALSPWATEALKPPRKPIDEAVADVAVRVKDRLVAKAAGREYVAPAEPARRDWSRWYTGAVVAAGVLAVAVGTVGLVARHDARLNGAAVAVGASAVVFQYALMVAAAVLLFLLIALIVSAFDGAG